MTLVRVYCGLASAGNATVAADVSWLTMAIVDDSGRLLDLCDINDDPDGYAELCGLFAMRCGDPGAVAVASEQNHGVVTRLLHTVGGYVAYAEGPAADQYAEQFGDDDSIDEIASGPPARRAIGLARALQAGVIWAAPQTAPPELVALKPILAAHAALVTGRIQAAGSLREVLRELYPAALRAYADPAERVSLAVLEALPEGGQLRSGQSGREREDEIVAELVGSGVAEKAALIEAVVALRVAVAETPRRNGLTRAMISASAEVVRRAVGAVISFDAATEALIGIVADRVAGSTVHVAGSAPSRADTTSTRSDVALPSRSAAAAPLRVVPDGRRSAETIPEPVSEGEAANLPGMRPPAPIPPDVPAVARAAGDFPVRPAANPGARRAVDPPVRPAVDPPIRPAVDHPARSGQPAVPAASAQPSGARGGFPTTIPPSSRQSRGAAPSHQAAEPPRQPYSTPPGRVEVPAARPLAPPPPVPQPPPPPSQQPAARSTSSEQAGNVFEPAAYLSAPPLRFDPKQGYVPDRYAGQGVAPRLSPDVPAPGSRSTWPLDGQPERDDSRDSDRPVSPATGAADVPRPVDLPRQREGRVMPPWQADDLPTEPPMLRLVEPAPIADPALSVARVSVPDVRPDSRPDSRAEQPALRLVEPNRDDFGGQRSGQVDTMPAEQSDDSDLLIFSQCQSAWFTDGGEIEEPASWKTAADTGWQAAEQAARPAVGADTGAGLPRRVPQQNLVPGSPLPPAERSLRIVRDAASIAAHTSGYFRGYRKGQEVGGYAVGGRPGRESAGGWDFSREASNGDRDYLDDSGYGYRSAGP